jgi:stage II sporulation protein D
LKPFLILVALSLVACGQPPRPSTGGLPASTGLDEVRVALQVAVAEASFSAPRGARWESRAGQGSLSPAPCVLRDRGGRIELEQGGRVEDLGPGPVRISTPGEWQVGGDRFGGDLIAQRATWGGITLVNLVDLELYLRGVVPWEIGRPEDEAVEAVKAQAIAARTYTIQHLGRWEELGFDVYADVRDQVYRGLSGTAPITDRAVRETRGLVLSFGTQLVRAYYSSTCGGHTSTLTDVWDRDGAPYLEGFRDADARGTSWCARSPHFRWTEAWSARELGGVLRSYLGDELDEELVPEEFGVLQGLEVLERDASGRVSRLEVRTDRGRWVVWGDRIRWALRPVHSRFAILRSTLFEVEEQARDGVLNRVVLRGGGFGHGVGLCQTGALERARQGQSARDILKAYYGGATVGEHHARRGPS